MKKNKKNNNKKSFKKVEGNSLNEMCQNILNEEKLSDKDLRECAYPQDYKEALTKEVWKPLYGFEETHEISSMGRVRSKPRYYTSKDGRTGFVKGTTYKMDNDSIICKFMMNGKPFCINVPDSLGKSFYGDGDNYSLINPFSLFVKENREEEFVSLKNICSVSKKNITVYNKFTNEETLINSGGLIMLMSYLNQTFGGNKPKEEGRFTKEDLLSATEFKVDDNLGLIISGINYLPNIEIIIRRGAAYKGLITEKETFDVISSGHILDENQIGRIWTGKEIHDGLVAVMKNNANLHRFALGMLNRYFKQAKFPLNFNDDYLITSKKDVTGKVHYQVMSYFKLARYKEMTLVGLPKETLERLKKDRKITKKYDPKELTEVARLKLSLKKNKSTNYTGEKKDNK